jgi:hypothetical protein
VIDHILRERHAEVAVRNVKRGLVRHLSKINTREAAPVR